MFRDTDHPSEFDLIKLWDRYKSVPGTDFDEIWDATSASLVDSITDCGDSKNNPVEDTGVRNRALAMRAHINVIACSFEAMRDVGDIRSKLSARTTWRR